MHQERRHGTPLHEQLNLLGSPQVALGSLLSKASQVAEEQLRGQQSRQGELGVLRMMGFQQQSVCKDLLHWGHRYRRPGCLSKAVERQVSDLAFSNLDYTGTRSHTLDSGGYMTVNIQRAIS